MAVVALVAAAAFAALAVWAASPLAPYVDHGTDPGRAAGGRLVALAAYEAAWVLMVLAMMLPTATRLLAVVGALGANAAASRGLRLRVAAGFVATWAVVGYLFRTLDVVVHTAVDASPWLTDRPQLVTAASLAIAGAFQFSDLKHRCLTACRTPRSFAYRGWHGGDPHGDALRIGGAYGLSCVGCCWALMLVMFAVGMTHLGLMLALAAVMSTERYVARSLAFGRVVGLLLLAAALAVAVR